MKKLFALLAITLAAGCTTMPEIKGKIASDEKAALSARQHMVDSATTAAVTRIPAQKIIGREIQIRNKNELPPLFNENVVYISHLDSVEGIFASLAQQTGIPIVLAQPVPKSALPGPEAGATGTGKPPFRLEWRSGTLKALLDNIGQQLSMFWRYRDGRVEFIVNETRSFHVFVPAGDKKVTASIALRGASSGSTSGSGAGSDSVNVASNTVIDPYSAIAKTVGAMLSEGSAKPTGSGTATAITGAASAGTGVVVNAELGMITVTAAPPLLDRVGDYIESINKRFAQNVMIDVKVFAVNTSAEAGSGFSMTALLGILSKYGLAITGAAALQTNGRPGTMTIDRNTSNTQVSLLVSALQQFGNVSLMRSGQVMAVNGQPSPMQLADEITYLASSTTTQTANVGVSTTLTPGSRTVGFTANFLPMILGDNRILLQYQINLSSLLSLDQVSSGGSMIQTPSVSTQTLQQQAFVRDGQSIVLFGFESERNEAKNAMGFGNISNANNRQRNLLVIVMQVFAGQEESASST